MTRARAAARVRGAATGDEGSGTVLMVGVVAVLCLLAAFVAVLAGSGGARGAARTAADLAAVGAASAWMHTADDPCSRARDVALRNSATVTSCSHEGSGVYVVVTRVGAPGGRSAVATARAGPASAGR